MRIDACSPERPAECGERAIHVRIRGEFAEMPGLKLTLPQAACLFNLTAIHCERVLSELVADGLLCQSGGTFLRADGGRRWA